MRFAQPFPERTFTRTILHLALLMLTICGCNSSSERDTGYDSAEPVLPDLTETYDEVAELIRERFEIVKSHPDSAIAWGSYGMVLDAHEFRAESTACYRMAIARAPEDMKWAYYLAHVLKSTDPDQALAILESDFPSGKSPLPVLLLKASLLQESGQAESSDDAIAQAMAIDSANPCVIVQYARRCIEKQQWDEAKAALVAGASGNLATQFQDAAQLVARIETLAGNDDTARSILAAGESLPLSQTTVPDQLMADLASVRRDPLWLGEQYAVRARSGDNIAFSRLRSLVKRYPELEPNRIHLAMLISDGGNQQAAESIVSSGLETRPDSVRLMMALGAIQISMENWSKAEQTLRMAVKHAPNNADGWADLGFVLQQRRKFAEAVAAVEKSLSINPDDQQVKNLHAQLLSRP